MSVIHRSMPAKKKTVLCTGECNEEKKIACFRKAWTLKKNYNVWVCKVCEQKTGRADEEMEADESADEIMEGEEEGVGNFEEEPAGGVAGSHGAAASRPKRKQQSSPSVEVCVCVFSLSFQVRVHPALVFTVPRWCHSVPF
jgi:hypothetical protein